MRASWRRELGSERQDSTHCCPWPNSRRATGLPRNMTFAHAAEKVNGSDRSRSRVASFERKRTSAERLHPYAEYSRCRPTAELQVARFDATELPFNREKQAFVSKVRCTRAASRSINSSGDITRCVESVVPAARPKTAARRCSLPIQSRLLKGPPQTAIEQNGR